MPFHRRRRALAALAAILLRVAMCQAEPVFAGTFEVTPTLVVLSGANSSALLALGNEGSEPLRLQIRVLAWDQDPKGEMKLTPTEDIVFFPILLVVEPGRERKVRLGSPLPAGPTEKSYRIFFEELPPAGDAGSSAAGPLVRVLTRIGVPIFLQPATPQAAGAIEALGLDEGRLRFRFKNNGNVHIRLQSVRVRGAGAAGEEVFEQQAEGWYVLPGGTREYELSLPSAECARTRSVGVEALMEGGTFSARLAVPLGACGSSAGRTSSALTE